MSKILVSALDVTVTVGSNKQIYVESAGWFQRFSEFKDDLYIISKGRYSEDVNALIPLKEIINLKGYFLVPSIKIGSNIYSDFIDLRTTMEGAAANVDKIYVRYQGVFIHFVCDIAKRQEKPIFIEIGGVQWDAFWNYGMIGKMLAPTLEYWCKKDIRNADYVHYVTKEYLQKRYKTSGKTIGLSNVELQEINTDILDKRKQRITNNDGKIVIGTAAAVDVRYKGQQYVIKALSIMKHKGICNFEYQIVGQGDDSYLRNYARKIGVQNSVVFLGKMSHRDVFDWMDTIDVYIQPSLQEGLPRAMVEAMSRALPCIGAKTAGIPELIDKAYVYRHNHMERRIIKLLLKLSDKREMFRQAEKNILAAKQYRFDVIIERRKQFYSHFFTI